MKKKCRIVIVVGCTISLLAGCEKTPEETIVKEKGTESIQNYESGEKTDKSLRDMLGAPEHYTNNASYENGGLIIDTDADIILPEVSNINTISVSAKAADQKLIDTVTNTFFRGDKIYNAWSYQKMTKEDIQEKITLLKKYKAEGNMDPYEYGRDENGNLYYDIDAQIERYEEELQTAPEETVKEEVTPAFGLEYPDGEKGEDVYVIEDEFYGVVETKNGNYNYIISNAQAPDTIFKITKIRDDVDPQEFTSWQEGRYLLDREGSDNISMSEDKIKEYINISYDDAEKLAKEKVEKLGWNMELYNWDYSLFFHGEGGISEENILDGGYLFHFTRVADGVPVTYTEDYGGALEDMDSTLTPWSYERCDIIVGNDGIEQVEIYNPYEVEDIQTENVKLMDFDSIIQIYEQMMEISNADISQYEGQRTFHIKKIVLGYTRIYDPASDNDTGILIPVWDFFGGFDTENDNYWHKDSGEHSNQSFLTINAIDGTVIERGLGY